MSAVDDPMIGALLGSYELTTLLGKGGMGRVYLGVHTELGTKVAIKVLAEEYVETPEALERFVSEARAAARVEHEAIVRVIDVVRGGERPHLVMEYVDGKTLRSILPTLTIRRALQIMATVLDALHAAHDANIIHRDLKPDNVMITSGGDVRILDFGVAKLLDRMTRLTATGVTVGTSEYMSPEQIRGRPCDGRSDVYAAGVMLFELVTGTRPFEANTEAELLELHLTSARPSAKARNRRLSDGIDAVIRTAMAIDPDDRFESARAMARAIRAGKVTSAKRGPIIALVIVTIAAVAMATVALTMRRTARTRVAPPAPAVIVDAMPLDAAVDAPLDAALVSDAPLPDAGKTSAARVKEPTHTCTSARECPNVRCFCKNGDERLNQWCERGVCLKPTDACTRACSRFGGFGGTYSLLRAITREDCAISPECKRAKRCKLHEEVCMTGCSETEQCRTKGLCADGPDDACVATSDASCAASLECARIGECVARDQRCAASADTCKASAGCIEAGLCHLGPASACVVLNDADCESAEVCTVQGRCKLDPATLYCVAANPEACAKSRACAIEGRCGFKEGICVYTQAGCEASEVCQKRGQCTEWGSRGCLKK